MGIKAASACAGWVLFGTVISSTAACAQEVQELPGGDRALPIDFEEVYRVGGLAGAAWEAFGEVGGAAFDGNGNLYIFDKQAPRIVTVDPRGSLVRRFGGPGDGPGEFRTAIRFAVFADGETVVSDMGHRAYLLFDPQGKFRRMVRMAPGSVRLGRLFPDRATHSVFAESGGITFSLNQGPDATLPPELTTRPIEKVMLDGGEAALSTFVHAWKPPRDMDPSSFGSEGILLRVSVAAARVFEPPVLLGTLPNGGAALSDSSAYSVKIVAPDGQVARILRRPFHPAQVTRRVEEAEKQRRLAELSAAGSSTSRIAAASAGAAGEAISEGQVNNMMRAQVDGLRFYPELPVIFDLRTSWGGLVWVQRRGDDPVVGGPIDVLTSEGEYVGTMSGPAAEMPIAFGPDGLAAFLEVDDYDVATIVVRRLPSTIN